MKANIIIMKNILNEVFLVKDYYNSYLNVYLS